MTSDDRAPNYGRVDAGGGNLLIGIAMTRLLLRGCAFAGCLLIGTSVLVGSAVAGSIHIGRPVAAVGDRLEQTVEMQLALHSVTRQQAKVLDEADSQLRRYQLRTIVATEITKGVVTGATVEFAAAERAIDSQPPVSQPIVGKRYHCRLNGEQVRITTPTGAIPPPNEYEPVAELMGATLGRVSPLSAYFAGREVQLGEKLELPPEVGQGLLGNGDAFGRIGKLTAIAQRIEAAETGPQVVFDIQLTANGHGPQQVGLLASGELVLDVASSRVVELSVGGPIGIAETSGGIGEPIQTHSTGNLRIAIESQHTAATR